MITEQYVTLETAKLLKKAGFDTCVKTTYRKNKDSGWFFNNEITEQAEYNIYNNVIEAPTQSLAAKWLREVQGLHVYALQTNLPLTEPQTTKWEWGYIINKIDNPNLVICHGYCNGFQSYEKALEVGLQKALKLIKIAKQ